MKSKIVSFSFILLSFFLLIFWFNFNYKTRQLEKKISQIEYKIKESIIEFEVLNSELAAHLSPNYIIKLSSVYLDYEDINNEKTVILSKKKFINKINEMHMLASVSSKYNKTE